VTDWFFVCLLAMHLLCVNVSSAGPLVAAWLEWRGRVRTDVQLDQLGRWLAVNSLWSLLAGSLLGLATAVLLWLDGQWAFFRSVGLVAYKVWWGVAELVFYVVCMAGYVALWPRAGRAGGGWLCAHRALAVLAATNLMYHFPPLFGVIAQLAAQGDLARGPLDAAGFRAEAGAGPVWPMTVHFWLASLAVTGVFAMAWGPGRERWRDSATSAGAPVSAWLGRLALAATVLQIPTGMWVLLRLPLAQQGRLVGGDGLASVLLIAAIALTIWLLHDLASIAMGAASRSRVRRSAALVVLIVLLMSGTQHRARNPGLVARKFQGSERPQRICSAVAAPAPGEGWP